MSEPALTYAIGDLHGRFDLLCEAISITERHAGDRQACFIVCGDFVDRGPQSRAIIDLLMAGPSLPNWRWIVLQGNHEVIMLKALINPELMGWWARNGGGATLRSYGYAHGDPLMPLKVPIEHLKWLGALPVWHDDGQRIFVHAGIPPAEDPADASEDLMQWALYDGAQGWAGASYIADQPHKSGRHIVHGHEQSDAHPLLLPHRTNLDSFAWATGRLAIGVFGPEKGPPIEILEAKGAPDPRWS